MQKHINAIAACLASFACLFAFCIPASSLSGQAPEPEEVSFCDVVREPANYNGHLVRITAQYSATAHAALMTGKACPSSSTAKYFAAPAWGSDFDAFSKSAKALFKILKKGDAAELTLIGFVHALPHEKYGFYDAPVQIEIKRIEIVKRDFSP
jgi:hypothetical protein